MPNDGAQVVLVLSVYAQSTYPENVTHLPKERIVEGNGRREGTSGRACVQLTDCCQSLLPLLQTLPTSSSGNTLSLGGA